MPQIFAFGTKVYIHGLIYWYYYQPSLSLSKWFLKRSLLKIQFRAPEIFEESKGINQNESYQRRIFETSYFNCYCYYCYFYCCCRCCCCYFYYYYHHLITFREHSKLPSKDRHTNPGTLFTKPTDVSSKYLVKSLTREIGCYIDRIALKFDRHLGSTDAEIHDSFQSDWRSLKTNFAATSLHEILR